MFDISDPVFLAILQLNNAIPVFGWDMFRNGVSYFDPTITIGNDGYTPEFVYTAEGFSGSTLSPSTYGENLSLTGSVTKNGNTPFVDNTETLVINGSSGYFQANNNTLGDLGSGDFVFAAVVKASAGNADYIYKRSGVSTSDAGWSFRKSSTTILRFAFSDGANATDRTITISEPGWYVIVICVDKDEPTSTNAMRNYTNCSFVAGTSISTIGNISTPSLPLTIGAKSDGSGTASGNIALLALWKADKLFPGGIANVSLMDSVARQISHKIMGLNPQYGLSSTYMSSATPRSSNASTTLWRDGKRNIYWTGLNWFRLSDGKSPGEVGALVERQVQNLLLRTTALNNGTVWSFIGGSTTTTDSSKSDQLMDDVAWTLSSPSGSGEHGISQSVTTLSDIFTLSTFAYAGLNEWLYMDVSTLSSISGYFYIPSSGDGYKGTIGNNVINSDIEYWGNGLYRCSITFSATNAMHTFRLLSAVNNEVKDYTATAPTIYLAFPQLEALEYMSSYMLSTTSATTRVIDIFSWSFSGEYPNTNAPRTIILRSEIPKQTDGYVLAAGIGTFPTGVASPSIGFTIDSNTGYARSQGLSPSTEWSIVNSSNIADGNFHTVRTTAELNNASFYVDGTLISTDNTVALVPSADNFKFGTAGGSNPSGVVSKVLVYNNIYLPGESGTGDDIT